MTELRTDKLYTAPTLSSDPAVKCSPTVRDLAKRRFSEISDENYFADYTARLPPLIKSAIFLIVLGTFRR